jgi:hypothetical protein
MCVRASRLVLSILLQFSSEVWTAQVHWKWSSRLTKLLVQCLESSDYMEIRNALTILTKLSSVFPVMKKSGANLERRVILITVGR